MDQIAKPPVQPKPLHQLGKIFPWWTGKEREERRADIKKHGLLDPIYTFGGLVIDGKNREREAIAAGVDLRYEPVDEMLKAHGIHIVDFVRSKNLHRRHLTAKEKRVAIKELLKGYPNWSDRKIADVVGADHKTVGAYRTKGEASGEFPQTEKRVDRKGDTRPAKRGPTAKRMPEHPQVPMVIDPQAAVTLQPSEYKEIDDITDSVAAESVAMIAVDKVLDLVDELSGDLDRPVPQLDWAGRQQTGLQFLISKLIAIQSRETFAPECGDEVEDSR